MDKELSDNILKIYLDLEPSSLSRLLLDSNMKTYSFDIAIKYLNKHKKCIESKGVLASFFIVVILTFIGSGSRLYCFVGERLCTKLSL